MRQETLMVITPQGPERWDINKTRLNITSEVASRFARENAVRLRNIAPSISPEFGPVSVLLIANGNNIEAWWTLPVLTLTLRTPFAIAGDKVLVPSFAGNSPQLTLPWTVDQNNAYGMWLYLVLKTVPASSGRATCGKQYLVARDINGMFYRLPVSNVYADCEVCTGQFDSVAQDTHTTCLFNAAKQFVGSSWNKDLLTEADNDRNTAAMFRFAPDNDGFKQLPMLLNNRQTWQSLCAKVSTEVTTKYITV